MGTFWSYLESLTKISVYFLVITESNLIDLFIKARFWAICEMFAETTGVDSKVGKAKIACVKGMKLTRSGDEGNEADSGAPVTTE